MKNIKSKILSLAVVGAVLGLTLTAVAMTKEPTQSKSLTKLNGLTYEVAEETDLVNYEVYYHFVRPYKNYGNVRVKELMEKGMSSEEACSQAITEMIDIQVEHTNKWWTEYSLDLNENGVYDLVENNKVTEDDMEYLNYICNSPSALTFEFDLSANEQSIIDKIQGKII